MFFQCVLCLIFLSCPTGHLNQLLVEAIRNEDVNSVSILLHNGADPSAKTEAEFYGSHLDVRPVSFIHLAIENNNAEIVELLLQNGADPGTFNRDGRTPLIAAVEKRNPDLVVLLLKHGAKVDDFDDHKQLNALMAATSKNEPHIARILIDHGANWRLKNTYGWDTLMIAKLFEHEKMISLLQESGARMNSDSSKLVAFFRRIIDCRTSTIALSENSRHQLLKKNHLGWSAIAVAAENGCIDTIEQLVQLGLNINMENDGDLGSNALAVAVGTEDPKIVEKLLELGIDPNKPTRDGDSPLHISLYFHHLEHAKILIKYGADVNARNPLGMTPLILAIMNENKTLVQELLENGADPMVRDGAGNSALDAASKLGRFEILKMILDFIPEN